MDDTQDRIQFQKDLEDVNQDRDYISDFTDELLGIQKPRTLDSFFDDKMVTQTATIQGAANQEEFLRSDLMDAKSRVNSKLMKEFTKDEIKMLYVLALSIDYRDNNQKADMLKEYMVKKGFVPIGTGTNRMSFKKGRYCYKFALDRRGIADMLNEARRSVDAPQFLAHCFECCGVAAVDEYVDVLDRETFANPDVKAAILTVLNELSKEFIFGDMGYDSKNYCNIGTRHDSQGRESLVFLDFAYMHPRIGNEEAFTCIKDGTPLRYNSLFTKYVCPKCQAEYDYRDILWRLNANKSNFENSFLAEIQSNLYLDEDIDTSDLAVDADI